MKITKQRLKEIIKEELEEGDRADRKWASNPRNPQFSGDEGSTFEMSADELTNLGQTALRKIDNDILDFQSAIARLVEQHDGGEFVHLATHASMLQTKLDDLKERYIITLGNWEKNR